MDPITRPGSLTRYPTYLATQLSKAAHRLLLERLDQHGLRLHHFAVLAGLSDLGPVCQQQLCDGLDIDKSHMVTFIDDLRERDFVVRERDIEDRRRYSLVITQSGKDMLANLHQAERECQQLLLAPLDQSQRQTLVDLLQTLVEHTDAMRLGQSVSA